MDGAKMGWNLERICLKGNFQTVFEGKKARQCLYLRIKYIYSVCVRVLYF